MNLRTAVEIRRIWESFAFGLLLLLTALLCGTGAAATGAWRR